MTKPLMWTTELRTQMFRALVAKFGPFEEWETTGRPGRGLDDQYDEFCDAMMTLTGAKSIQAVKHQIAYGKGVAGQALWENNGRARTALSCLTASVDAGFIRPKDLPDLLAVRSSKVMNTDADFDRAFHEVTNTTP